MRTPFVAVLSAVLLLFCGAAFAQTSFQRDDLADESLRYEAVLRRDFAGPGLPAAELAEHARRTLERGDARAAVESFSRAVTADPGSAALWQDLARALMRVTTDDWQERYELPQRASSAAYIAYRRAGTEQAQAEALAVLGEALVQRQYFRPALDAYKASLDLADDPGIRATYAALLEQHGFRVLDYTVDSDAASPRACVQFSETLAEGRRDYEPFVSIEGASGLGITAEDQQICVDGLRHGERYALTVREGVPSSVGESLRRSARFQIYVRDRSPAVRFTGRNYVLPRTGQQGIPVASVNTDAVALDLLRVGDRSLAALVAGGEFRRQLSKSDADRIAAETGARVWTGEMPVTRRLNTEVTTAFPVSEAIGALEPGVYALVATPKEKPGDDWTERATQWFIVSDLGLTAFSGREGVHVVLRSLASAEPVNGVRVRLVARNGEVLGERSSDAAGHVRFDPGLARGEGGSAPALVTAEGARSDYAFLDLTQPPFDLTDRGVEGREPPGPLDAFVFAERGVYRPGESVHLTTLLRDAAGSAAAGTPLTIVFERPDGVEHERRLANDQGAGGRSLSLDLLDGAMTGTWTAKAYADPEAEPIGRTTFLVEDYVPERLDVDLSTEAESIAPGAPDVVTVNGRYLYGAPAADLVLTGEVVVSVREDGPDAYPNYRFGLTDEEVTPVRRTLADLPRTDAAGRAVVPIALPDLPATTRPLEARIALRLAEAGGRGVEETVTLPVSAEQARIGVRPLFDDRVGEGEAARFEVIALDPSGQRIAQAGLRWELYRLDRTYQWYRNGGSWNYEAVTATARVADGLLDVDADMPARVEAAVQWGRYRLDVVTDDPTGPATSVVFDAGFQAVAAADTPDRLDVALDAADYAPGDVARIRIEAGFAGKATLAVVGARVFETRIVDVPEAGADAEIPIGDDWGAGAYVLVTLHRPLDVETGRMPGRAVGLAWIGVDQAPRTLDIALEAPGTMRPRATLGVDVSIGALRAGEEAYFVAAAVDVGILNLTGYETPDASGWFLGQRALGTEMRDLYGQLIDGMRAERGRLRSGGDGPGATMTGRAPVNAPLALFQGVTRIGEDGKAHVDFEIPAFNGTVRLMVVAWSGARVGEAIRDVVVRDPVVVTGTLPRFMAEGDTSELRLDLANTDAPGGSYTLEFAVEGPVAAPEGELYQIADLAPGGRTALRLPLTATGTGTARIDATLIAPDGTEFAQGFALDIQPPAPPVSRRMVRSLAPGASITLSDDLLAGLDPDGAQVSLSVSPSAALDVPGLLLSLDRYPYGCGEQITSRALPLLYVDDLAGESDLALDRPARDRIVEAIEMLAAKQDASGSFGLWAVGSGDLWLDSYVTDFLTRAREKRFAVSERVFAAALDRLENALSFAPEIEPGTGTDIAYASYVLARNGRGEIGDLRYLADVKIGDLGSALAQGQVAAALAMLGDRDRAEAAAETAFTRIEADGDARAAREDYGSAFRDNAALVALAGETGLARDRIAAATEALARRREALERLSTQEEAWALMAAHGLQSEGARLALELDGTAHAGSLFRSFDAASLGTPVTLTNRGDAPVDAVIGLSGMPTEPEPAVSQGFSVARAYYTVEGVETSPERARQGDRFVVVLTMTEPVPERGRVLLVDHLPAGFEIDNPRLVDSASLSAFSWLTQDAGPVHTEFRDDRFVAAFERDEGSPVSVTVAYVVRAVAPGAYAHPAATVEDMYRPERLARTAAGRMEVAAP